MDVKQWLTIAAIILTSISGDGFIGWQDAQESERQRLEVKVMRCELMQLHNFHKKGEPIAGECWRYVMKQEGE